MTRTPLNCFSVRAYYFLSFGAMGAIFPYLALVLSARGIASEQLGWVLAILPISSLALPPIWGAAADAWRIRVWLLRIATLGCAASVFFLFRASSLASAAFAVALFAFFRAPLSALADATAVHTLEGDHDAYASIRLWGSIGFAVFAAALGALSASSHPALLTGVAASALALSAVATWPLVGGGPKEASNLLRDGLAVLRQPGVRPFLAASVAYYFGHSIFDAYFGIHARFLGFDDGFVGASWTIGVGAEVLLMFVVGRLPELFRGRSWLALCAGVSLARWLLLAWVDHPAVLLVSQLAHGLTFGLWYLSLVSFTQQRAPAALRTSTQATVLACVGLGMSIGYVVGGRLYDNLHEGVFLVAASGALLALVLYTIAEKSVRASLLDDAVGVLER